MMIRLLVAAAMLLILNGCSGVSVNAGLPVLVKPKETAIVNGVQGPPDISRGNQARLAGRFSDAVRDLKPLAESGYPDAQVYLAATYIQMDTAAGTEDAIRWYRAALPRRPEIDVALARALIDTGNRKLAREALSLILRARDEREDPTAESSLLSLYSVMPDFDKKNEAPRLAEKLSRSPYPANRIAAIAWYRQYVSVGNNASRLFTLCKSNLDIHLNCYIDLAQFYRYGNNRKALDSLVTEALEVFGRGAPPVDRSVLYAIPERVEQLAGRLAAAMVENVSAPDQVESYLSFRSQEEFSSALDDDAFDQETDIPDVQVSPTPPVPDAKAAKATVAAIIEKADQILRWMLKQPGDFPLFAAISAVPYPYLLPDIDIGSLLRKGVDAGNHAAYYALGDFYLAGQRTPMNPELAEQNYLKSLQFGSTALGAHYRLGRMYVRSELGRPNPEKALENYLAVGRRGNGRAYYSLAIMFTAAYGIRADRVNAYVFARRAEDSGRPLILRVPIVQNDAPANPVDGVSIAQTGTIAKPYKLLDKLRAEFTPDEQKRADALYEAERRAFPVVERPVLPDVYANVVTQ